jgi:hypothetical protein
MRMVTAKKSEGERVWYHQFCTSNKILMHTLITLLKDTLNSVLYSLACHTPPHPVPLAQAEGSGTCGYNDPQNMGEQYYAYN